MTRINVVDPSLLSDKHLGAEYRELPRIFGLVRKAAERGEAPTDQRNPSRYRLGPGHVRFFYPRLGWLLSRYRAVCDECRVRGRAVNYSDTAPLVRGIAEEWFGQWAPDDSATALNIERINQRGGLRADYHIG